MSSNKQDYEEFGAVPVSTSEVNRILATTQTPRAKALDKSAQFFPARSDLPGYQKTKEKIAGRGRGVVGAIEEEAMMPWEWKKHPVKTALQAPYRVGKLGALTAIGLPAERLEGVVANVGMKMQETPLAETGLGTPPVATAAVSQQAGMAATEGAQKQAKYIGSLAQEAWKGLTGEKQGQIGDILRQAGVPEPVAATTGLVAMAGLTNALSSGKIATYIKGKIPKLMGKNFTAGLADEAVGAVKQVRKGLGVTVNTEVLKNKNVPLNQTRLDKIVDMLPDTVKKMLRRPEYKIAITDTMDESGKKILSSSYNGTVGNAHQIRQALDDFMTAQAWEETAKTGQQLISRIYGTIGEMMRRRVPALKEGHKLYNEFMDIYRRVVPKMMTKSGQVVEKPFREAFKPGNERKVQQAFEKLAEYTPQLKQIMLDMTRYTRRQLIGETVKKTLPLATTGAAIGAGGAATGYAIKALSNALNPVADIADLSGNN